MFHWNPSPPPSLFSLVYLKYPGHCQNTPRNVTPCPTLFVASLGPTASEQELVQVFSRYEGIVHILFFQFADYAYRICQNFIVDIWFQSQMPWIFKTEDAENAWVSSCFCWLSGIIILLLRDTCSINIIGYRSPFLYCFSSSHTFAVEFSWWKLSTKSVFIKDTIMRHPNVWFLRTKQLLTGHHFFL